MFTVIGLPVRVAAGWRKRCQAGLRCQSLYEICRFLHIKNNDPGKPPGSFSVIAIGAEGRTINIHNDYDKLLIFK
jgi:hypothetical protein